MGGPPSGREVYTALLNCLHCIEVDQRERAAVHQSTDLDGGGGGSAGGDGGGATAEPTSMINIALSLNLEAVPSARTRTE